VVTYKDNQCRLLDGCKRGYFMIVAMLLTLVHEGKPHFGKPEVEHRVPHGQFSRSRSASGDENPSLGNYAIPITTADIHARPISLAFTFLYAAEKMAKG